MQASSWIQSLLNMTLWGKVFGFPSLTLAAIPESLLAIKLFPDYYNSQSHLATVIAIIAVNYALGAFFWVVVYPNFLSPLRRIPGPRVSTCNGVWYGC